MPYSAVSPCCSSMLTLAIFTRPSYSSASSPRIGAIILHGPHHSAQKSTRTGVGDWITSTAKFSCVNVTILGEAIQRELARVKRMLLEQKSEIDGRPDRDQSRNGCGDREDLVKGAQGGGGRSGGHRGRTRLRDRGTRSGGRSGGANARSRSGDRSGGRVRRSGGGRGGSRGATGRQCGQLD